MKPVAIRALFSENQQFHGDFEKKRCGAPEKEASRGLSHLKSLWVLCKIPTSVVNGFQLKHHR